MHRNFWRHNTSCLNMSIIIHTLTPTELAALAPTESSCTHLNKLRLGFGRSGPGGCCCWGYRCSAAWPARPAKQVKDVTNAFLEKPALRQRRLALEFIPSDSLFCFNWGRFFLPFSFPSTLFLLGPIRKLSLLHLSQSLFYVEIFQNSRSSCSAPCNWKKFKVGQGTKSADINNITLQPFKTYHLLSLSLSHSSRHKSCV